MAEFVTRISIRVIGITGDNVLRVIQTIEGHDSPLNLPADVVPPQLRMPNSIFVRAIDHMNGRRWIEDVRGTELAVLEPGHAAEAKQPSTTSSPLAKHVRRLLDDLDAIASAHEEVSDTDVREQMWSAMRRVFFAPEVGFEIPDVFGMFSTGGNRSVRDVLNRFVDAAKPAAEKAGLRNPQQRLEAFQDSRVESQSGSRYDDYFGHAEQI
ncbi:MAG: hypothetical protein H7Z14_06780 [Anaerolineae bacterium]|nr:hypothetical protein [Phycisphaerae bacterium]